MDRHFFRLIILILGLAVGHAHAVSMLPLTNEQQAESATAICRGTLLQLSYFRGETDGAIYTKAIFHVDEPLKGKFAANVQVVFRGGILDGEGEVDSASPRLTVGEERLIFLERSADRTLRFLNDTAGCLLLHRQNGGKTFAENEEALLQTIRQLFPNAATAGEDVSDQGASVSSRVVGGLLENSGVPSRFIAPDRGEAIPYIVDAQTLPSGITLTQALNAVSNAFRAWSQVSSVKFTFEGTNNFGQAAPNLNATDRKIRVQLHDLYGFITGPSTLGQGGRQVSIPGDFPNGGNGGNVGNREFFESTSGFVVLKHTQTAMQNLATFTEVLCHEIGHVLSLDHSSETNPEANTTLEEAMMYFQAHADGRGATLGTYDPPMIRSVHPTNTPPYSFGRIMDAVTAPSAPNIAGINEVELRGYDLQNDTLSLVTTNVIANNCTFAFQGTKLKATPDGFFNASRFDPEDGHYYDGMYVRFYDASNGSPWVPVRILSYSADSQPSSGGGDGLPDSWMTQYFGTTVPSAGSKTRAQDDFDGDGVSNLNEFICGTVPTNAASVLKISSFSGSTLQWIAKPYDLYEVQHSTNLTSWTRATTASLVTTSTGSINSTNSDPRDFFRVQRVP